MTYCKFKAYTLTAYNSSFINLGSIISTAGSTDYDRERKGQQVLLSFGLSREAVHRQPAQKLESQYESFWFYMD